MVKWFYSRFDIYVTTKDETITCITVINSIDNEAYGLKYILILYEMTSNQKTKCRMA